MIVAVGRNDAIFGAARQGRDRRTGQALRKVGGKGAAQVGTKGRDRRQPLPLEEGGETAHGGFDFGEFGHIAYPATRHLRGRQGPAKGRSTLSLPRKRRPVMTTPDPVSFGYEQVPTGAKPALVGRVFSRVAHKTHIKTDPM